VLQVQQPRSAAQLKSCAYHCTSNDFPMPHVFATAPVLLQCNAHQHLLHLFGCALQEYPSSATAGRGVFRFLSALPSQVTPAGLAALVSVQLDAFPEAPVQWAVLQVRPSLTVCTEDIMFPGLLGSKVAALALCAAGRNYGCGCAVGGAAGKVVKVLLSVQLGKTCPGVFGPRLL
jgi:hypothetical protein